MKGDNPAAQDRVKLCFFLGGALHQELHRFFSSLLMRWRSSITAAPNADSLLKPTLDLGRAASFLVSGDQGFATDRRSDKPCKLISWRFDGVFVEFWRARGREECRLLKKKRATFFLQNYATNSLNQPKSSGNSKNLLVYLNIALGIRILDARWLFQDLETEQSFSSFFSLRSTLPSGNENGKAAVPLPFPLSRHMQGSRALRSLLVIARGETRGIEAFLETFYFVEFLATLPSVLVVGLGLAPRWSNDRRWPKLDSPAAWVGCVRLGQGG